MTSREAPTADPLAIAAAAADAVARRDWAGLRPLLHPYLHWTNPSGEVVRGRAQVLAHLAAEPTATPSQVDELRDGQVYRWEGR